MNNPEPAGKTGPKRSRKRRVPQPVEQVEVLETEPVTDAPGQPQQWVVSPQVYDFIVTVTGIAEGLKSSDVKAMSRLTVAQAIQSLATELRNAVQRKSPAEVTRGTLGISAWCLLLWLSVNPQYLEVQPEGEGGGAGGETEAQAEAS